MRPADFTYKQGDTRPIVRLQALDGNGVPIDLKTLGPATAKFHLSRDGVDAIAAGDEGAVVEDDVVGWMHYVWNDGQTDAFAGTYDAEFEVTYAVGQGGGIETFPNGRDLKIVFGKGAERP